jgi:hypothetical protein
MITSPTVNINNIRNRTPRNATNGASNVRNVVTKTRPRTATVSRILRYGDFSQTAKAAVMLSLRTLSKTSAGPLVPASARSPRARARDRCAGRRVGPCSDLTSKCTEARHRCGRPMPLGMSTMSRAGRSPRRGWKWWTCGNGGFPGFQEAAGSHFHPNRWKCNEARETVISTFTGLFSWTVDIAR